jgi:carbon-monoxide dehydrogenase large subunit
VKHQNTNSEETIMSETGIGARMVRKEDHRFITGKGRYTDDINMPGQAFAVFVRSPYAHAEIKKVNTKAAEKADGVLCVLTGKDASDDNIGGLICGWMIHSKDGTPMKAGPHPVLAQGKVRHVGDQVAVVVADTLEQARDAAEARSRSTTRSCRCRVIDMRQAPSKRWCAEGARRSADNTCYDWEIR